MFVPDFSSELTGAQRQSIIAGSYGEYGWPKHLAVYFVSDDGGRARSKRPKQKNDCTVRSVAIALQLEYDQAYDLLQAAGRKCSRSFAFRQWASSDSRFQWVSFPAVKGQCRMNPAKFCPFFNRGRWIAKTAKHVFAVVDGVIHDEISPGAGRCIYGAWRVQEQTEVRASGL